MRAGDRCGLGSDRFDYEATWHQHRKAHDNQSNNNKRPGIRVLPFETVVFPSMTIFHLRSFRMFPAVAGKSRPGIWETAASEMERPFTGCLSLLFAQEVRHRSEAFVAAERFIKTHAWPTQSECAKYLNFYQLPWYGLTPAS